MAASPREPGPALRPGYHRVGRCAALLLALMPCTGVAPARAQVPAEAVMRGRVVREDSVLTEGWVVLHHILDEEQGVLDSTRIGADGTFRLPLPRVPDPQRAEVFLGAVRHDGVLYVGPWIALAVQLDSTYVIEVHDTVMVAGDRGRDLPVEVRTVFMEPEDAGGWKVTDVFLVHHDGPGTLVTDSVSGAVWRHTLPASATDAEIGQSDAIPGTAVIADGQLVVRSATPPGEQMYVVQYHVPDAYARIPVDVATNSMDVLIREPAPALEVPGFERVASVQIDQQTYRRFLTADVEPGTVTLVPAEGPTRLPLEWLSVVVALALTAIGLWAAVGWGPGRSPAPEAAGVPGGDDELIQRIARLDDAFEAGAAPSPTARQAYTRERRALLDRLRAGG